MNENQESRNEDEKKVPQAILTQPRNSKMMNTMRFKANSKLAVTQKKKKPKYDFNNVLL